MLTLIERVLACALNLAHLSYIPEKQAATNLRVKVYNKTNSDYVDQFTTAVVPTGNYEVNRVNSYEISDSDYIEYQVFYKGNSEDNDETPLSATRTRRITFQ